MLVTVSWEKLSMKQRKIGGHVEENPEVLTGSVMEYAPVNEHGVVALFTEWAKAKRFRINRIQSGFPDCIATIPTGRGSKQKRIEFEFRSSNFRQHGHDPSGCDWIVCWEHDWPEVPKKLNVFELRKYFGLGFNVWMCPVTTRGNKEDYSGWLRKSARRSIEWSMPHAAHVGDLILFYHAAPVSGLGEVYEVRSDVFTGRKDWRVGKSKEKDYYAKASLVAYLNSPLPLKRFQVDPVLRTSGFVRAGFRGRVRVTEHWPFIADLIVAHNPRLRRAFARYPRV